jgi:hypothetical protein
LIYTEVRTLYIPFYETYAMASCFFFCIVGNAIKESAV